MRPLRIADGYAHLRMDVTVLGAARLRDGRGLLYVRRSETKAWTGGYGGYTFSMLQFDPRTGAWVTTSASKTVAHFIATAAVGVIGRPGNRIVEVIDPSDLHPGGVLVVEPPVGGWLWQRGNLSEEERANVAHNFGRTDVAVGV